ncbi:MAG: hypothetical protein N3B10_10275 [Armatimonadetes bacterium]|nr:hypothetical protein [Armatimonadota bacterium]MCX7968852.1 hypothetical protein [Armatimonadota bacterium]MDW8143989.1 hypothetical protein [Armatimonadota bacterium]
MAFQKPALVLLPLRRYVEMPFRCDLYDDPFTPTFRLNEVADYLRAKLPKAKITAHGELVREKLDGLSESERETVLQRLAIGFAKARVHDPYQPVTEREPLYGEIAYERRRLAQRGEAKGVVYDGFMVQELLASLFDRSEMNRRSLPIVFTNQLLATFDESDHRYHLRTVILGYPAIVSTTGLVEAPAKPREFYIAREQFRAMGLDAISPVLAAELKDRCLLPNDERLTEVAKGYALQAVFYALFGEAFCDDKDCRLYNAHWQEEMLHAQLNSVYDLCPHHETMLKGFCGF